MRNWWKWRRRFWARNEDEGALLRRLGEGYDERVRMEGVGWCYAV